MYHKVYGQPEWTKNKFDGNWNGVIGFVGEEEGFREFTTIET